METYPDLKAAPFPTGLYGTKDGRSQRWRKVPFQTLLIAVTLIVTYCAYSLVFGDGRNQVWQWKLEGDSGETGGVYGSSQGGQYLLGVGKADITG